MLTRRCPGHATLRCRPRHDWLTSTQRRYGITHPRRHSRPVAESQEQARKAEEQEEAHRIGDEGQQDAESLSRVAPGALKGERDEHADQRRQSPDSAYGGGHHQPEPHALVDSPENNPSRPPHREPIDRLTIISLRSR